MLNSIPHNAELLSHNVDSISMNHTTAEIRRDLVLLSPLAQTFSTIIDQPATISTLHDKAAPKSRIAFGSCNEQSRLNPFWPVLEQRKPAAFIWGGDAIYSDFELPLDWSHFPPTGGGLVCGDETRLRTLYEEMHEVPGYKSFLKNTNVTVFGTYDDHDYGCNNADRNFEHKYESAVAYVDFLGEPKDSLMAKRASDGHGVYGVKLFDFARPGGQELVADDDAGIDPDLGKNSTSSWKTSNKTVAVFVLDCRFHKTPWEQGHARYRPDYNGDFLGERQWQWFESAIRQSKASVNIVVNGLQVHPNLVPDGNVAESWSKYPVAQQRLFDAMLQEGVEAPILISGDVHMAQIMRKDCKLNSHNSGRSRPLMEMTTSGMTHSWGTIAKPLENPDEPPSIKTRFESFFAGSLMGLLHRICPWRDLLISSTETNVSTGLYENGGGEGAKTGKQFSLLKNFGELEFDWEARTVVARVIGENAVETPLLSAKWSLDQLSGRTNMPGSKLTIGDFEPTVNGKWTCLSHRGNASYVEHALGHAITGAVLVVILPFPFLVPLYVLFCLMRRGREKGPMLQSRSR